MHGVFMDDKDAGSNVCEAFINSVLRGKYSLPSSQLIQQLKIQNYIDYRPVCCLCTWTSIGLNSLCLSSDLEFWDCISNYKRKKCILRADMCFCFQLSTLDNFFFFARENVTTEPAYDRQHQNHPEFMNSTPEDTWREHLATTRCKCRARGWYEEFKPWPYYFFFRQARAPLRRKSSTSRYRSEFISRYYSARNR